MSLHHVSLLNRLGRCAAILAISVLAAWVLGESTPNRVDRETICPLVEVVFCLDTTGSMGGLIADAKTRIWGIVNGIAGAVQGHRLRVGLLAYRDRGDQYVTRIIDLTDNLEAIQVSLNELRAEGGGDGPESVNQALHEAMSRFAWSGPGPGVYRAVFLVGDAPPHMDYKDDVLYPASCRDARKREIVINAIQCGAEAATRSAWQSIASEGGGEYAVIPQASLLRPIFTPYDAWLTELSAKLLATAVYTGPAEQRERTRQEQQRLLAQARTALKSKDYSALVMEADRGEFRGRTGRGRAGGLGLGSEAGLMDLVENYLRQGPEVLKALRDEEMPDDFRALSPAQREELIRALAAERESLLRHIEDMTVIRDKRVEAERRKDGQRAFEDEVLDMVRQQASVRCR